MRNKPVNWSEGMFLRPHHFQAAERHFDERMKTGEVWDTAYNYGLRSIKINKEAIANYHVEVTACQARMADGTIIDFDTGEAPDRIGLKKDFRGLEVGLEGALASKAVVRIFLGVPALKLGRPNVRKIDNVGKIDEASPCRFVENELPVPDEDQGGNDQAVTFRDLNVRILASTEDLTGYERLPIMQIKRSGDAAAVPVIDEDYFPPLLSIDAWPSLGIDIIRAIYDFLGQQQERISEFVVNQGVSLASRDPADVDRIFKLHFINETHAMLGCMAFSTGAHPFALYCELCRFVARLGVFVKERRMPEAPRYDHDNLAIIFKWIKAQIESVFYTPDQPDYEVRYFEGYGKGMQVSLNPKWLLENWDWYVGVKRGTLSEADCRKMLKDGSINWKMGSAQRVDFYFDNRAQGLLLVDERNPPNILPTHGGWIFYKVDKLTHEFKEVQQQESLAMRFSKKYVENWEELREKRELVVNYDNKKTTLEFGLFAVKRR